MPMAKAVTARRRRVGSSRTAAGAGTGDLGRGRGGGRRFQPPLDLAGVLVDGLSAAPGLLGLAGDGPVASREDGGGVADPGAER